MKCQFCGKTEKKAWIKISLGHSKLVFLCCEAQKERIANKSVNFFIHRFKEPIAFGYDKSTGRPLALDKKGRRFDPNETRYNLKHDPYGWKATGKIPPKRKYFI